MKTSTFILCITLINVSLLLSNCHSDNDQKEGNWEGCVVGAYTFDIDGSIFPEDAEQRIRDLEALMGHEVGSIAWFPTWADPFPAGECRLLQTLGIIPHLTWELFWPDEDSYNTMDVGQCGYQAMDEILAGEHDEYLEIYAAQAAAFGGKLLIRFMHEFNGNWYVWSGNKNGRENGGPRKVVAVWKYVVDKFREAGAHNVKWLWVPHGPSTDLSTEAWNHLANYWPGDDYVDWIGLDAYNFYPIDPWGGERPYRDFDNCFRAIYDSCMAISDKPLMIAEFGSGEFDYKGLTKADWVEEAFYKIKTEYPGIKLFTWFHIRKEHDWRVNSSPETLKAFRSAMEDPYYIGYPYKE